MLKTISILAIAGLVLALAPAAQAGITDFAIDNPTAWRIAFVTTSTTDASSSDITYYNGLVNTAGALVSTTYAPVGTTYKVLGSTLAADAINNTGTSLLTADPTNVPIYTTTGQRIATGNDALWAGTGIENVISYDDGTVIAPWAGGNPAPQWTGTRDTGLGDGSANAKDDNVLGSGAINFDNPPNGSNYIIMARGGGTTSNNNDTGWIDGPSDHDVASFHLLGLSEVIPEPATMSLLAIGGIALIRRRKNR
jgi:hypothetical protein